MNYKFKIQVNCHRRPNKLDDNFEMMMYIGQGVLRQIFVQERVDPTVKNVHLWFPESWLNVVQERSIFDRLEKYCPNLEELVIDTHSVYIIQCTPSGMVKIISSQAEQDYGNEHQGLPQECIEGVQSFTVPTQRDFSKIQVFRG